jgi:predicted RNA-binding protein
MLKTTREIWKFLKENLVTRKPEKQKFLTILKKKNWLINFARQNTKDTRAKDLIQGFSCLKITKQISY